MASTVLKDSTAGGRPQLILSACSPCISECWDLLSCLPRRGCWLGKSVFQSHAVCLLFWPAWMRGCALRVFPTGPSRGLPAHRAFQPVLVSVPPSTQRVLRVFIWAAWGLMNRPPCMKATRSLTYSGSITKVRSRQKLCHKSCFSCLYGTATFAPILPVGQNRFCGTTSCYTDGSLSRLGSGMRASTS